MTLPKPRPLSALTTGELVEQLTNELHAFDKGMCDSTAVATYKYDPHLKKALLINHYIRERIEVESRINNRPAPPSPPGPRISKR